jgi:hypothetical protein
MDNDEILSSHDAESTTNTDSMITVPLTDRQSSIHDPSFRISTPLGTPLPPASFEEDSYFSEKEDREEQDDAESEESLVDTTPKKQSSSRPTSAFSNIAEITETEAAGERQITAKPDTEETKDGVRKPREIEKLAISNLSPSESLPSPEEIPLPSSTGDEFRSSTSTTQSRSSNGSNASPSSPTESVGVDWEKLDKTEEQEHRNDATDEVCYGLGRLSFLG